MFRQIFGWLLLENDQCSHNASVTIYKLLKKKERKNSAFRSVKLEKQKIIGLNQPICELFK